MKKKTEAILSGFVIVALTVSMLYGLTRLTELKDSYSRFSQFYEQEADFDVLMLGTSHPLNALYPMELWTDCGIVSYNFSGTANTLATTYWMMENALEHTSPKLVFYPARI